MKEALGISITKLRKAYGDFVAVHDLDLEIAPGEFVSFLGPSGCGKTTTLRMLAGLAFPTSGAIRFGGQIVNDVAPAKRDIAMVFQSYALYPHMTVAENICYPLRKRGVPKVERPAKLEAVAKLLQLEPVLTKKPAQLSGGQQQRVALGRALVREPGIFLLDEPLSNLDAKLRAHMRFELIELHRKIGRTMVYVTHDQLEAMTMSTRIAVMRGGRLQQFGTPSEIYEKPANVFVADFIGTPSMTLLDATLEHSETGPQVRIGEMSVTLTAQTSGVESGSRPVKFGVRPEDVIVGESGLPAIVKVVEMTGHESIVFLDIGGRIVTSRVPAHVRLSTGTSVKVSFRDGRIHLFDAENGKRLPCGR